MRTLLLLALALSGFVLLALGHWLGLFAAKGIRAEHAVPALLVETERPSSEATLRAELKNAGMDGSGALLRRAQRWPIAAPFGARLGDDIRLAIEVPAEAARSLGRLPPGFRLDRTAAGVTLRATLPDRGPLTRIVAWPVLQWQLTQLMAEGGHVPERVLLREDGKQLEVRIHLQDLDRGEGMPSVAVPDLQAPVLP